MYPLYAFIHKPMFIRHIIIITTETNGGPGNLQSHGVLERLYESHANSEYFRRRNRDVCNVLFFTPRWYFFNLIFYHSAGEKYNIYVNKLRECSRCKKHITVAKIHII